MSRQRRKRSAVFAIQGARTSLTRTAVARKSHYRCRGIRKWCNERCESQTSAVPDGYPKVGYYCRLHDYQKPKRGQALPDDESTAKWLRKIPSFAAYAAEEEKKTAQLGADQKFILHLKEADPPVIHDVRYEGKTYERCFLGSEFAKFCCVTFPRKFSDPLMAMRYGGTLMGQDGMIIGVAGDDLKRFTWDGVFQLAADAAAQSSSSKVVLTRAESATVRVAILKAKGLPQDGDTHKPVSPYVKVAYRDFGSRSDKHSTFKIGRTNLAWRTCNPVFGITDVTNLKKKVKKQLAGDLIRHKVLPAKANQVGRVIGARLVKWKRYFAPEPLINEWKESKQDEFAFQFHVPPPRIVYLDHTEKLPFNKCPGDINVMVMSARTSKSKGEACLGEINVPITDLIDIENNKGKRGAFFWAHLKPRPKDTTPARGKVLLRVQLVLPDGDKEDFGDSSDDSSDYGGGSSDSDSSDSD